MSANRKKTPPTPATSMITITIVSLSDSFTFFQKKKKGFCKKVMARKVRNKYGPFLRVIILLDGPKNKLYIIETLN